MLVQLSEEEGLPETEVKAKKTLFMTAVLSSAIKKISFILLDRLLGICRKKYVLVE